MDGAGGSPQALDCGVPSGDADSHEHHLRNVPGDCEFLRGTWLASENFRARFSLASEHVPGQTKEGPWSYAPGLPAGCRWWKVLPRPILTRRVAVAFTVPMHHVGRAYHQKQVFLALDLFLPCQFILFLTLLYLHTLQKLFLSWRIFLCEVKAAAVLKFSDFC